MFQLIFELRKNWRGRVDGTGGESKVLQEVLADLKTFAGVVCVIVQLDLPLHYLNELCLGESLRSYRHHKCKIC